MSIDRRTFIAAAGTAAVGAAIPGSSNASAAENSTSAPRMDDSSMVPEPGKTRFAVNLEMWWTRLPFLDRIREAKKAGFSTVEFWPWRGKPLAEIAELCKSLDIEIAQFTAWGFVPGLNNPKNHQKFVKEIEASCATAHQLNCSKMTVVGGNDQPGMTPAEMHQNIIDGLRLAAPIAEENQVMLILEPMNIRVDHKGHCLYGSPEAVEICRQVDSPMVKLNWDLYHMQISEGDLCGRMRDGFDQIGYLQLADHPGRFEPGTGEIHYNRVLKEAWDLGYRGAVGLECRPRNGEEMAVQRVRAADAW